jgi:ribosomal protein S14
MEEKIRCQSCGMPLGEGFFGTEADGSPSEDYCKFCYQGGAFVEPDLTLDRMLMRSIAYMTDELGFSDQKARRSAEGVIPFLKRWVR